MYTAYTDNILLDKFEEKIKYFYMKTYDRVNEKKIYDSQSTKIVDKSNDQIMKTGG